VIRWLVEAAHPLPLRIDLVIPDPIPRRIALVGPNGAGKTSLLRLWAGLGSGSARWTEEPPLPRWRFVLVPQTPSLWPHRRLAHQLQWVAGSSWRSDPQLQAWIERLHLGDALFRFPRELSGGQQQRATLLRALAAKPTVLALDEVLAQVDAGEREQIFEGLEDWVEADTERRLILTGHRYDEIARLAEWAVILLNGRVASHGPPPSVKDRPGSWEVARLVGYQSWVNRSSILLPPGIGAAEAGMAVREEDLGWPTEEPTPQVRGRVLRLKPDQVEVEIPAEEGRRRYWLSRRAESGSLPVGGEVRLALRGRWVSRRGGAP
jgi:ABC-type multidrug transport system ATPase subunit